MQASNPENSKEDESIELLQLAQKRFMQWHQKKQTGSTGQTACLDVYSSQNGDRTICAQVFAAANRTSPVKRRPSERSQRASRLFPDLCRLREYRT